MPEPAVAAEQPQVTPPPVSPADAQRALIARENGVTYDATSQTFNESAPTEGSGTTPESPASGEPAQNAPANSEAQGDAADTPVEGGGDEEALPAGDDSQQEQSQQPGKNHVARRIDKLTRENAQLARAVQQLLARQQVPVNGNPQQPQQPQQQTDPKPDPAKYTDVAQFIADTSAWTSRQEAARTVGALFGHLAQQAQQQQAVQQAAQQVQEFNDRVTKGSAEFKDFAQVTTANADVEVAPHVAASIMQGVENPAAVLYHLAKNPGEVAKLNQMHPAKVAVRLGAIEANAKRAPAISNAPKPGTPVAARGSVPTEYSDEMSTEAFMEMRARQTRKK
jgi:hypothetical protein